VSGIVPTKTTTSGRMSSARSIPATAKAVVYGG